MNTRTSVMLTLVFLAIIPISVHAITLDTHTLINESDKDDIDAATPHYISAETFRGKTYQTGSECEILVAQSLLSANYDFEHIVPAVMRYDAGLCDSANPPNWTECPDWINKELGFCDHLGI